MEKSTLVPSTMDVNVKVSGGISHGITVDLPLSLWLIVGFLSGVIIGSWLKGKT